MSTCAHATAPAPAPAPALILRARCSLLRPARAPQSPEDGKIMYVAVDEQGLSGKRTMVQVRHFPSVLRAPTWWQSGHPCKDSD